MSEELMIIKEDLVNWLNRPLSNDDLDLIGFITTRLENFYKLEQENKQLKEENKELNKVCELYGQSLYNADLTKMKNILIELEKWCKDGIKDELFEFDYGTKIIGEPIKIHITSYEMVLDKIQELKEKYRR